MADIKINKELLSSITDEEKEKVIEILRAVGSIGSKDSSSPFNEH